MDRRRGRWECPLLLCQAVAGSVAARASVIMARASGCQVVNVALPDLGADLGLSRTAFTWTVSVYGLVFGGLLLLGGRLADVFGARTMLLAGLVIFTLASLACGLAQTQLLGGRVGQGVGPRCCPRPRYQPSPASSTARNATRP